MRPKPLRAGRRQVREKNPLFKIAPLFSLISLTEVLYWGAGHTSARGRVQRQLQIPKQEYHPNATSLNFVKNTHIDFMENPKSENDIKLKSQSMWSNAYRLDEICIM